MLLAEAESVSAFLVNMHLSRYLCLSKGEVKINAVFGRHALVDEDITHGPAHGDDATIQTVLLPRVQRVDRGDRRLPGDA